MIATSKIRINMFVNDTSCSKLSRCLSSVSGKCRSSVRVLELLLISLSDRDRNTCTFCNQQGRSSPQHVFDVVCNQIKESRSNGSLEHQIWRSRLYAFLLLTSYQWIRKTYMDTLQCMDTVLSDILLFDPGLESDRHLDSLRRLLPQKAQKNWWTTSPHYYVKYHPEWISFWFRDARITPHTGQLLLTRDALHGDPHFSDRSASTWNSALSLTSRLLWMTSSSILYFVWISRRRARQSCCRRRNLRRSSS